LTSAEWLSKNYDPTGAEPITDKRLKLACTVSFSSATATTSLV
jgi:hypothetical protein